MIQQLIMWMLELQCAARTNFKMETETNGEENQKTIRIGCHPFRKNPAFLRILFFSTLNKFQVAVFKASSTLIKLCFNFDLFNSQTASNQHCLKVRLYQIKTQEENKLEKMIMNRKMERIFEFAERQHETRLWCHPSNNPIVSIQASRRRFKFL